MPDQEQDRYGLVIRGKHVEHRIAESSWRCGICGSRLVTRWFEESPNWRTLCYQDRVHDSQKFIHATSSAYHEGRKRLESMQARDVFRHLPAELQETLSEQLDIAEGREMDRKRDEALPVSYRAGRSKLFK